MKRDVRYTFICANKDQEDIELLELGKSGIHVAQYLTELPPRAIFEQRLQEVIKMVREKRERSHLLNSQ